MLNGDLLFRIWCVLSVLGSVELRSRGHAEDTGDPSWDAVRATLDYDEPEFNLSKGYTADDFTDNLHGFQTQSTIAKSFGWGLSGYGEIPFAVLLTGVGFIVPERRYCMGTAITRYEVVTPCACVRSLALRKSGDWAKIKSEEYYFSKSGRLRVEGFEALHYAYQADLGERIEAIANTVEFHEDHIGTGHYPVVVGNWFSKLCIPAWSLQDHEPGDDTIDGFKRHQQYFYPIVVALSRELELDTPCPWPPLAINYQHPATYQHGDKTIHYFYSSPEEEQSTAAIISSFKFFPIEGNDLSTDNDGRNRIKTEDRLVNLEVALCHQNLCNASGIFEKLNYIFNKEGNLNEMLCWCDVPAPELEGIYAKLENEEEPFYLESVYGGLVGAPIVVDGRWVGWLAEEVPRSTPAGAQRGIWTAAVDAQMIDSIEKWLPVLKKSNNPWDDHPVDDLNRPSFALREYKPFVLDSDISPDEVDFKAIGQVGRSPLGRIFDASLRSGASATLPAQFYIIGIVIAKIP